MNTIELKLLRNAEYLQYTKDFEGIINLNNPETLQIDTKLAAFSAKITELEALYKKALASETTQELIALDERRDNAINGMYYFLMSQTYHYEKEKRSKSQSLLDNMALYGSGIARLNYQAETAVLNNMIRDWENRPELSSVIADFDLSGWLTELKEANDLFNGKYLSRTQEYGDANPETIKLKREEANAAYYALRDRIDALHLLVETPPSPYTTLINQLNALTAQYNALLTNRQNSVPAPENGGDPTV